MRVRPVRIARIAGGAYEKASRADDHHGDAAARGQTRSA
jgi:hypothetical protein